MLHILKKRPLEDSREKKSSMADRFMPIFGERIDSKIFMRNPFRV